MCENNGENMVYTIITYNMQYLKYFRSIWYKDTIFISRFRITIHIQTVLCKYKMVEQPFMLDNKQNAFKSRKR